MWRSGDNKYNQSDANSTASNRLKQTSVPHEDQSTSSNSSKQKSSGSKWFSRGSSFRAGVEGSRDKDVMAAVVTTMQMKDHGDKVRSMSLDRRGRWRNGKHILIMFGQHSYNP